MSTVNNYENASTAERNLNATRSTKHFYEEITLHSTSADEYTLSDWLDYWLKTYKKQNVQSASYEDYCNLANHVKQHRIGSMELTHVKPMHIMEYFADKIDYSHSFRKRSKFLLNSAYERAVNNDICPKNPVRGAEITKKPQPEKEAFSEAEVKTILEFAKTDKWFGLPMYIMLNSGIRSQEMRALTATKIDFENGIIAIDTAVKRNGELGLPKNNKTRAIPMTPEVSEFIKSKTPDNTVFYVGGETYVSREGFRSRHLHFFNRLNKWLEMQGREPIKFKSPHATRHSCATIWQKRGMPIAMVAALLGHCSTDVTDKYTHVSDTTVLSEAVRKYGISP